jgi:hypothetical protein
MLGRVTSWTMSSPPAAARSTGGVRRGPGKMFITTFISINLPLRNRQLSLRDTQRLSNSPSAKRWLDLSKLARLRGTHLTDGTRFWKPRSPVTVRLSLSHRKERLVTLPKLESHRMFCPIDDVIFMSHAYHILLITTLHDVKDHYLEEAPLGRDGSRSVVPGVLPEPLLS